MCDFNCIIKHICTYMFSTYIGFTYASGTMSETQMSRSKKVVQKLVSV